MRLSRCQRARSEVAVVPLERAAWTRCKALFFAVLNGTAISDPELVSYSFPDSHGMSNKWTQRGHGSLVSRCLRHSSEHENIADNAVSELDCPKASAMSSSPLPTVGGHPRNEWSNSQFNVERQPIPFERPRCPIRTSLPGTYQQFATRQILSVKTKSRRDRFILQR